MTPAQLGLWSLLGVALVISLVTDVLSHRIPDVVTYPTLVAGLGLRFFAWGPGSFSEGLLEGALGAAMMFAVFGVLAWRGQRMGWGDVKLAAAVGACLGLRLGVAALVFISLVGALQAVVTLLWQGALLETLSGALRRFAERLKLAPAAAAGETRRIPYGVAIALGTFWAMWWDRTVSSS